MARLRSARMTNDTLVSQFDDFLGELESDLAEIFGFELDEDITASPFSIDNSGRLTKALIEWASTINDATLALNIFNSSNSTQVKVGLTNLGTRTPFVFGDVDSVSASGDLEVFGLALMTDDEDGYFPIRGRLASASGPGLIPRIPGPIAGVGKFWRADGQFAAIGRPSASCVLTTAADATTGTNTTFSAGTAEKVQWKQDSFDPNGLHATNDDEIIVVTAGKYLFGAQVMVSPAALDAGYVYVKLYRQRAAADTLWAERTHTFTGEPDFQQIQVDTIVDCNVGDKLWVEVYYDNGGIPDQVYTLQNGIANCHFWAARVS